jgi:hypothetical protein
MLFLPKGITVTEGQSASRDPVPSLLAKLAQESFTGYARYSFKTWHGVLPFSGGKLITAKAESEGPPVAGLDALTALCQRATTEVGRLDLYRLTPPLASAVHGVLHGEFHVRARELKALDVQGLAAKIKERKLNGCVRVYTPSRCSLIFYRDGAGTGFFHDGTDTLETTATDEQRIANLPGAKMDVMSTPAPGQLQEWDLLEMVNLPRIWATTFAANRVRAEELHERAMTAERERLDGVLAALEESLKTLAAESLGPMGRNLVTKELGDRGGRSCLTKADQVKALLAGVEKGARLVAGASKVKALTDGLTAEIEKRLSSTGP